MATSSVALRVIRADSSALLGNFEGRHPLGGHLPLSVEYSNIFTVKSDGPSVPVELTAGERRRAWQVNVVLFWM